MSDKEMVLKFLRGFHKRNGRAPLGKELQAMHKRDPRVPTKKKIEDLFGNISNAYAQIGIETRIRPKEKIPHTDGELIEMLKSSWVKWVNSLNIERLIEDHGSYCANKIIFRLGRGSLQKALEGIGVVRETDLPDPDRIEGERLLELAVGLSRKLGHLCTREEFVTFMREQEGEEWQLDARIWNNVSQRLGRVRLNDAKTSAGIWAKE